MNKKFTARVAFSLVFIVTVILSLFLIKNGFAAAGAVESPYLEWSLDAQLVIPEPDMAGRGVDAVVDIVNPLFKKLSANGHTTSSQFLRSSDRGPLFSFKTSGRGSVNDFRRILYTVMSPEFSLLGDVTDMAISCDDFQQSDMDIVIESNPSTGYTWSATSDSGSTESAASQYEMHTRGYGVPERQLLHLRKGSNGNSPIKLVYHRPWEKAPAVRHFVLKFSSLPSKLDLSDPSTPTTALPETQGRLDNSLFPSMRGSDLPTSWDWRTQGIVTGIRDQGTCGSCWAFGTVGIMESALWMSGVNDVDLSEQFLVSCNTSGWNCENGGLTAHMYHYDRVANNQSEPGAVLEADKPYTATDGSCSQSYNHPYRLNNWQFIVPSEFTMPTVDAIKSAIYTYGPITAGVCAGSGWSGYSGGIFSTNETNQCGGSTNHQIILVGWDDNNGNGYWILRNSWGSSWGINGYMNIRYETSRVGEGTSWVTTAAIPVGSIISGTVKNAKGSALRGVIVTLNGDGTGSTTTDSQGNYSFVDINDGTYTITAEQSGYAFNPASRTLTVSGVNVTGQNFTGTPVKTYSISGTVKKASGATISVSGVLMALSGDRSGSTTTDSRGNYKFTGILNGTYTITPAKAGCTFTPTNRTVSVSGKTVSGQNFTGSN